MGQANGTTTKRRSTYHGGQIGRKATLNYANTEFTTNYIRTGKYTIWTFLPKSLFEQFRSVPPPPAACVSPLLLLFPSSRARGPPTFPLPCGRS